MAGSSPQGPWVPLTSGPERPRHRNPRPPSPPATHTWPTFAGDNRDSHPNWWKQARKAGSGPPGPGSDIGHQQDRGPRRRRAARAAPGSGPAARSHGTVRSSRSHLRPKPGGSRRRFPCDRARKRARPPWRRSLRGAARSPAALLFAARHVPLPGGQHRPGRGRSAPSRGAAAPPSARPRDCSAASRPAAVSRAVFSPHTSELARQHRIHLTFKITESGHDAPARKLRTLPARQCGVRPPGVGGCH